MTKHRILLLRPVASCCSLLVQKLDRSSCTALLRWATPTRSVPLQPALALRLSPLIGRIHAASFSTANTKTNRTPKSRSSLVKFTHARLKYPDNFSHKKGSTSTASDTAENSIKTDLEIRQYFPSELVLDDFSISLPNLSVISPTTTTTTATPSDTNEELSGGIAIIGRNGSGKTLLGKAILAEAAAATGRENPYVSSGSLEIVRETNSKPAIDRENRHLRGRAGSAVPRATSSVTVAHVSFDSHKHLLEEKDERTGNTVTAFKTIALRGNAPGRLNPAARFLVVRFGLYPLLHRTVDTLSTGEIRKVLLVRALSQKPQLLLLDNAFDGLDVPSRKVLQEIISKTLRGFSNDLLVQGVSSKDTADSTQVVLMTHRAEELDEIRELDTVAWWGPDSETDSCHEATHSWRVLRRQNLGNDFHEGSNSNGVDNSHSGDNEDFNHATDGSCGWASGNEVLHRAMGSNSVFSESDETASCVDWGDEAGLPCRDSVREWWAFDEKNSAGIETDVDETLVSSESGVDEDVLVEAKDFTVRKGDATLLKSLSWTVRKRERWIVGGGNGAGKSTLSRLLALSPTRGAEDENGKNNSEKEGRDESTESAGSRLQILPKCDPDDPRAVVGWVSTESHMLQQQQQQQQPSKDDKKQDNPTTREFLLNSCNNASWEKVILPVLEWLGIADHSRSDALRDPRVDDPLATRIALDRPFHQLSQGEQKLVMIAAALALRPPLLVLDEPCQGLDPINRKRLLQAVEGICRSTDMALIYITHHLEEELMPSISNALHLKDRRAVYSGSIIGYSPDDYVDDSE